MTLDEGVIRATELYTLDGLKIRLDLTDSSYRALRDSGLPEIERGKRKYFLGEDVIAWLAGKWPNENARLRSAAASELDKPAPSLEGGKEMAGAVGGDAKRKGSKSRRTGA